LTIDRPLSFRAVRMKLQHLGFRGIAQSSNHAKFIKEDGDSIRTAVLPHYTELTVSVIASILRQSGISEAEFAGAPADDWHIA
jgi:predicted RNA binding protein YcfA (HicA-like mRNA interferase family)